MCNEIADDTKQLAHLKKLYETVERSADAKSHVFPWLPNFATKAKNDATKELYTLLSNIIEDKKKRADNTPDTIQTMIELGDSTADIVGVRMMANGYRVVFTKIFSLRLALYSQGTLTRPTSLVGFLSSWTQIRTGKKSFWTRSKPS